MLQRIIQVRRREGWRALFRKGILYARQSIYAKDALSVFEHDLVDIPAVKPSCDVDPVVVQSLEDLEKTLTRVRPMPDWNMEPIEQFLLQQAWLLLLVCDGEIAHRSWVSLSQSTPIDPIASFWDYDRGPYIGDCLTVPQFRGFGLYPYALTMICDLVKSRGVKRTYLTVSPHNQVSIRGVTKAGFRECGAGYLIRTPFMNRWTSHFKAE